MSRAPLVGAAASRRAYLVWAAALAAYAVAVLHRSSFGVVGVEAVSRFDVGATALSAFVVVQVAVYAALQVPMGVLLDRFGSRVLITTGALLMATGQLLLGVVDDIPLAFVARVLIGAGDAATFISVIRLVVEWFPLRRIPLYTQVTGLLGQIGQLAAAVPLVLVLHEAGWTSAFVGLAAVGVLAALLAWTGVRDQPPGRERAGVSAGLVAPLRAAVRTPGSWLGFWSHSVSQFSASVFALLWGFPFLTVAQGLTPAQAGGLLSVSVLASMVSGPVIGILTARHPLRRSWIVLGTAIATAGAWAAVLVPTGRSPLWLLAVLVVVLGVGGSVGLVGMDFARTFNPSERLGTATGLVNVGGFSAAVLSILAVGVVLDLAVDGGAAPLSLAAFRPAFAVLAVPWLVGVVGILVSRRSTRRAMRADGVVVPPLRDALARRRNGRASDG
ncbi:nitrate/nitrite transporter [Cellulomonas sp. KRMCY2]|uniref:MFS transporter n=1 Tax=Cellulomonas sp. KRMCY2 TaxID=1304865 RepID=UPI0004A2C821|nr:MFS transporter [Cellulomonas sp. KRMCY2]